MRIQDFANKMNEVIANFKLEDLQYDKVLKYECTDNRSRDANVKD